MVLNIMVLLNLFSDEEQDEEADPDTSSNNSLGGVDYRNFEASNFTLAEADIASPQDFLTAPTDSLSEAGWQENRLQ